MSNHDQVLAVEHRESVAILWLDRPEDRNALGPAFWSTFPRLVNSIHEDDNVRALVLAARGDAFTIGLDLKQMGGLLMSSGDESPAQRGTRLYQEIKKMQAAASSLAHGRLPVIGAIQGYCIGAGIDLITACDVRLASASAQFSVRETRMAIVADLGTLQRLPQIIPAGHAAELIYTGKNIDAQRAKEIGLVNDVYPDHAAVVDAAVAMAQEMAQNSPLVVGGIKQVLRAGQGRTTEEALDYVALWNSAFLQSNDLAEAITAFFEKRPPKFTGD